MLTETFKVWVGFESKELFGDGASWIVVDIEDDWLTIFIKELAIKESFNFLLNSVMVAAIAQDRHGCYDGVGIAASASITHKGANGGAVLTIEIWLIIFNVIFAFAFIGVVCACDDWSESGFANWGVITVGIKTGTISDEFVIGFLINNLTRAITSICFCYSIHVSAGISFVVTTNSLSDCLATFKCFKILRSEITKFCVVDIIFIEVRTKLAEVLVNFSSFGFGTETCIAATRFLL